MKYNAKEKKADTKTVFVAFPKVFVALGHC